MMSRGFPPRPSRRVIAVPRPLASFFLERLQRQYADREDIAVVIDRRHGERRRLDGGRRANEERRRADRRAFAPGWSLAEMPLRAPID